MTSTIFNENAYDDGIRDAITRVIDDWGFRYPGIERVDHVYFYAVGLTRKELPIAALLRSRSASRLAACT